MRFGPRERVVLVLPTAFLAEGLWTYWHELHYRGTTALWLAIGAGLMITMPRGLVERRWLVLTLPAGLVAEVLVTQIYRQSF